MKIFNALPIIKTQFILCRTPYGRVITNNAKNTLLATIEDTKNYNQNVIKCLNCGIIISSLLVPGGCPNCGGHDLDINILGEPL